VALAIVLSEVTVENAAIVEAIVEEVVVVVDVDVEKIASLVQTGIALRVSCKLWFKTLHNSLLISLFFSQ